MHLVTSLPVTVYSETAVLSQTSLLYRPHLMAGAPTRPGHFYEFVTKSGGRIATKDRELLCKNLEAICRGDSPITNNVQLIARDQFDTLRSRVSTHDKQWGGVDHISIVPAAIAPLIMVAQRELNDYGREPTYANYLFVVGNNGIFGATGFHGDGSQLSIFVLSYDKPLVDEYKQLLRDGADEEDGNSTTQNMAHAVHEILKQLV